MDKELAKKKIETSTAAFAIAQEGCTNLGGDKDASELAKKIVAEREKTAETVALLDAEDKKIADLIKDGETDFNCAQVTTFDGVKLSSPVRPYCNPGFCCGSGLGSDGVNYETCQLIGTTQVVYRPMRAKNATSRKPSETLDFACIEGAQKLALSVAALASTLFIMS